MKRKIYNITISEKEFWLIMMSLESELCLISTRKKQDRKKLRQEYYNKKEIEINCLMDYLYECTNDKQEQDELLKKFLKEC
jgi:hypothetical protein